MSDTMTRTDKPSPSFSHRLYTGDFEFDFMKHRRAWYTFSAVLILISLLAVGLRGLNLGIEFVGGSVFQAPAQVQSDTIDRFTAAVDDAGVSELDAQVNSVGSDTVRVQTRSLTNEEVTEVRAAIADEAGVSQDDVAYSLIGPSWGEQLTKQALGALVVFLVLVGLLIWIYFREWKMSVSALIALAHDLIVTVGLYALVGFSVTPSTVIAVLTILGYSLYDTVVVFDMVREKTRDIKSQQRTYTQAANAAINQVLVRSINTTIIAVLPVIAILVAGVVVLGGDGPLADLGLAMLIGMVSGAYSSIFLATPLLAHLREREPEMRRHRAALEKNRTRARARVSAAVTDAEVSPASMPLAATPASGTLEFAEEEVPVPVVDDVLDPDETQSRNQPRKSSRSNRKK